jgi:hypothetical protein
MRILWPSFVNAARNTRCFERLNDHLDNIAENVRDVCAPSARVGQRILRAIRSSVDRSYTRRSQ